MFDRLVPAIAAGCPQAAVGQVAVFHAPLRLALARLEYGRPFFLPPGVLAERVTALRRAFDAALKDPAMIAEADKSKIEIDPLFGEGVTELVRQVSATPPDVVARVRAALEKK